MIVMHLEIVLRLVERESISAANISEANISEANISEALESVREAKVSEAIISEAIISEAKVRNINNLELLFYNIKKYKSITHLDR